MNVNMTHDHTNVGIEAAREVALLAEAIVCSHEAANAPTVRGAAIRIRDIGNTLVELAAAAGERTTSGDAIKPPALSQWSTYPFSDPMSAVEALKEHLEDMYNAENVTAWVRQAAREEAERTPELADDNIATLGLMRALDDRSSVLFQRVIDARELVARIASMLNATRGAS